MITQKAPVSVRRTNIQNDNANTLRKVIVWKKCYASFFFIFSFRARIMATFKKLFVKAYLRINVYTIQSELFWNCGRNFIYYFDDSAIVGETHLQLYLLAETNCATSLCRRNFVKKTFSFVIISVFGK